MHNYENNITTNFIKNITGDYKDVEFCMFKSETVLNGKVYNCERVFKNGKNGLYFTINGEMYQEYGFDIEAEDPRIFILNEKVYIIFICLSIYENQNRCIALTEFDSWNPRFLQIENIRNGIEKNWAPFVKNNAVSTDSTHPIIVKIIMLLFFLIITKVYVKLKPSPFERGFLLYVL